MILFSGTIICQGIKYLVNVHHKSTDATSYAITVDGKPYTLQKNNQKWHAPGLQDELAAKIGAYLPG